MFDMDSAKKGKLDDKKVVKFVQNYKKWMFLRQETKEKLQVLFRITPEFILVADFAICAIIALFYKHGLIQLICIILIKIPLISFLVRKPYKEIVLLVFLTIEMSKDSMNPVVKHKVLGNIVIFVLIFLLVFNVIIGVKDAYDRLKEISKKKKKEMKGKELVTNLATVFQFNKDKLKANEEEKSMTIVHKIGGKKRVSKKMTAVSPQFSTNVENSENGKHVKLFRKKKRRMVSVNYNKLNFIEDKIGSKSQNEQK
jgi:hypothetical protein